jgi:hypothetical protein
MITACLKRYSIINGIAFAIIFSAGERYAAGRYERNYQLCCMPQTKARDFAGRLFNSGGWKK